MSIKEKIKKLTEKQLPKGIEVEISSVENPVFGHYSTNVAMKLAKEQGKNPREVGEALVSSVKKVAPKDLFSKIEVAGPGFINFYLSPKTLQTELKNIYKEKNKYGKLNFGKGKKIIVEYSQPNIAKKMHVGHLRSTIIGDALANIMEECGYKVIRWNYLGDWGTQFGKLIYAYKKWGSKAEIKKNPIDELLKLYVHFHDQAKTNPELEDGGREEFNKLERGDRENRALWKWFREESLKEFKNVYKVLGINFDVWIGESAYEKQMTPIISELKKKGIAGESEGALVVNLEEQNLPVALIAKSDGASLYLTRDLASVRDRNKKYKPQQIIYVVANEQTLHFEQMFAVAKKMGIGGAALKHAKFGLVLGEDKKKLSTREGRAIQLSELIDKILVLAEEAIAKKNADLSVSKKKKIAKAVGIGALKYNDLKENRNSDIVFDWERMLDFSGNSAPYLQYTRARLNRIIKKAGKVYDVDFGVINSEGELNLIKKLLDFPDEIKKSAETLYTNNLATYLFSLAVLANKFYETTPILKEEDKKKRAGYLALISSISLVIKKGLGLLGIESPEEI